MIARDAAEFLEAGQSDQRLVARAVETICSANETACKRLLGQNLSHLELADRRDEGRNRITLPFYLFPVEWMERPNDDLSPVIAVTKDFSTRGIGFRCDVRVPLERVMAEFDAFRTGRIRLLLEIRWRRRESMHSYLAGGHILAVLPSPDVPEY